MTTETKTPREAKGGTFAPADINLIRDALLFYIKHPDAMLQTGQEKLAVNLLHRLGRIS
jgi:hypothetical protein